MWTILSHARLMDRNSNSLRTQSTPGLSQPGFGPSAEGEDDDDEPGFGLPEPEGDLEGGYSYMARPMGAVVLYPPSSSLSILAFTLHVLAMMNLSQR